jgi:hypothetical protein
MTLLDAATFVLGTSLVLIVFTMKNNVEKSRVKVKVKAKK